MEDRIRLSVPPIASCVLTLVLHWAGRAVGIALAAKNLQHSHHAVPMGKYRVHSDAVLVDMYGSHLSSILYFKLTSLCLTLPSVII